MDCPFILIVGLHKKRQRFGRPKMLLTNSLAMYGSGYCIPQCNVRVQVDLTLVSIFFFTKKEVLARISHPFIYKHVLGSEKHWLKSHQLNCLLLGQCLKQESLDVHKLHMQ